jgi:hypothetical protein
VAGNTAALLEPPPAPAVARRARRTALVAELPIVAAGIALILLAMSVNRSWLDSHSLPYMFLARGQQLRLWAAERAAAILIGLMLVGPVRHRIARGLREGRGSELAIQALLIALALPLSLAASELLLGSRAWRGVDRWAATEEPLRITDPRIGWRNAPSRTGWEQFGGRRILYHLDHDGNRVGDPGAPVDPRRPSILFSGESIMLGFRLNWRETLAGRIAAGTGLQSANLAVNGYSTDQALMRLSQALPHFQRPVAVVMLFAPGLLERNLEDDRPHLDADLRWHAARPAWRLEHVLRNVFPYHHRATIDDGIAMTRAALGESVREARLRDAAALILVPAFGPETPQEREIRRRVLDEAGLPYVTVALDPRWRLAGDGHPDAMANRVMAAAVLAALRRQRPDLFAMPPAAL